MAGLQNLVNEWLVRGLVLLSLAAHILLIPFAGIRRRKASGWRRAILWLAYQLADWVATFSIGKLFLGSTSREQQLVAFWLPFLLIHLGRPDNINAYSLEDNKLSGRQVVEATTQVVGAGYVLYNHIIISGGSVTFLAASVIMFLIGIIKYLERVRALWVADFGSIRSSGETRGARSLPRVLREPRDSEQALLDAHDLFHITEGAFADYSSVDEDPFKPHTRIGWRYGWEKMLKVVEMELSIMYDILYTKAKTIHTRPGYVFRAAWPFFTLTASLLFWFSSKDGLRRADIYITYTLLAATFLLDMGWLLRALVSAGTYAFLKDRPACWLHHQLLCTRRWHRLRRVVVSDLVKEPTSCRMWSGRIGQYNLLHECTHETTSPCWTLAKLLVLEDSWKDCQYHYLRGLDIPPCVWKLLFERIWVKLKLAYIVRKEPKKYEPLPSPSPSPPPPSQPPPPADAVLRRRNKLDEALGFDPELQVDILVGHIATDIFLLCSGQNAASCTHVKVIKALSDYMVFLIAVRPDMLPGLKLSSLHKATSDAMQRIWCDKKCNPGPGSRAREQKLARFLQEKEMEPPDLDKKRSPLYDISVILSDGTRCAKVLLGRLRNEDKCKIRNEVGIGDYPSGSEDASDQILDRLISVLWGCGEYAGNAPQLLDFIFNVWVRMLIYVSIRCSRESHAKQLSRGGELTTIVWIMAEHAGVLGIDEDTCRRPTNTDRCSVM